MSWTDDTQLHEASIRPQTPDGPDDHPPGDRVTGWRVHCDCYTPTSAGPVQAWDSELLVRVPTPALQDLEAGRIYATDDQAELIDLARDDVGDLAVKIWQEAHIALPAALAEIAEARIAADTAQRRLDVAVSAARTAGASWEAIGRAAAVTRQSAHQRWVGLDRAGQVVTPDSSH